MIDDVEITQKDIKNWVEKCKKELLEDNLNLLDEHYQNILAYDEQFCEELFQTLCSRHKSLMPK